MKAVLASLCAVVGVFSAQTAFAAADPAAVRIDTFDAAVVGIMKDGPRLGAEGRYRRFTPVVEEAFDLPLMTRFAVGPSWNAMASAEQQALVRAFTRLTAANYAHNFDSYDGERFIVDPSVQTRGEDKIVTATLSSRGHSPVRLIYRMRQAGGRWKIVDVYYDAVSQLTTRRSDFAGPLAHGGAKALLSHIDAASDRLLR